MSTNKTAELSAIVEFDSLVVHAKQLIFKDDLAANANETDGSTASSGIYLAAYLKVDGLDDTARSHILDSYIEYNPYYEELFLKHNIPYFVSRLAKDLEIIKEPGYYNDTILSEFKNTYMKVLKFFFATIYSVAMESDVGYRNFCKMSMVTMTILNIINQKCSSPFNTTTMDEYTVDNFLYSFGINVFSKLPLKYKRKLVGNINTLISDKGSTNVFFDILNIFDFQNIDIYKYFLIKQSSSDVNDVSDDVRFAIVNINEKSLNAAIKKDTAIIRSFEEVTGLDEYWGASKAEITSKDFSHIDTKYFSLEASYDLFERTSVSNTVFSYLKQIKITKPLLNDLFVNIDFIGEVPIMLQDVIDMVTLLVLDTYNLPDQIILNPSGLIQSYSVPTSNSSAIIQNNLKPYIYRANKNISLIYFNAGLLHNTYMKNLLLSNIKNETNAKAFKKVIAAYRKNVITPTSNMSTYYKGFNTYYTYLKSVNTDITDYIDSVRANGTTSKAILELIDVIALYSKQLSLTVSSDTIIGLIDILKLIIEVFKSYTVSLQSVSVITTAKEKTFFKFTEYSNSTSSVTLGTDRANLSDAIVVGPNTMSDKSSLFLGDSFVITVTGVNA